ncbi:hypothetical protein V6R21_30695 [Limibacter armeniacum]|uniref:hypothetical protein n=1 Tax=Limibacter armeniacum TaxID=466084 RepID=UPI002FE50372
MSVNIQQKQLQDKFNHRYTVKKLRGRVCALEKSRGSWKGKYQNSQQLLKALERENKQLRQQLSSVGPPAEHSLPIAGHKYNVLMVSICIHLYVVGGCSFRGVVSCLQYLNSALGWHLTSLPSKSAVETWVKKLGYFSFNQGEGRFTDKEYALIVDECMTIGDERMLMVLGVEAENTTAEVLTTADADVLHIEVQKSWKADQIKRVLKEVAQTQGEAPKYVISDSNNNLVAGIKAAELCRVKDVGHQLALLAERCYKKDDRYIAFMKSLGACTHKNIMKPVAYLLPPRQRDHSRFLNLTPTIDWVLAIQKKYSTLTREEQECFAFLQEHNEIVKELETLVVITCKINKHLKNSGLSTESIDVCLSYCETVTPYEKLNKFIETVKTYLKEEVSKLEEQACWHCSSDVIESLFGIFKYRKSPNKLYGVTSYVLYLALVTRKLAGKVVLDIDIKSAQEQVFLSKIKEWEVNYLKENQVLKRMKALSN